MTAWQGRIQSCVLPTTPPASPTGGGVCEGSPFLLTGGGPRWVGVLSESPVWGPALGFF